METTFESWFDVFIDECKNLGYEGPIDPETFEAYFEAEKEPEEAAAEFVREMNS